MTWLIIYYVVWVRVLISSLKHRKVYKNARIACAENIAEILRKEQATLTITQNLQINFFEEHENASSMSLSCEEMTKMRSFCTKYETKYLQSSNDMEVCVRIYHKIKLNKDAVPIRHTYGSINFEKDQPKKIIENLQRLDLVHPIHFYGGSTIITDTKKDATYCSDVVNRGLNKQREKKCWPLQRFNDWCLIHRRKTCTSRT